MNLHFAVFIRLGSLRAARDQVRAVHGRATALPMRAPGRLSTPRSIDLPLLDKMHKEYPKSEAPDQLPKHRRFYPLEPMDSDR